MVVPLGWSHQHVLAFFLPFSGQSWVRGGSSHSLDLPSAYSLLRGVVEFCLALLSTAAVAGVLFLPSTTAFRPRMRRHIGTRRSFRAKTLKDTAQEEDMRLSEDN